MFFALCLSELSGIIISSSGVTIFLWLCFVGLQILYECHKKSGIFEHLKCFLEKHLSLWQWLNFLLILRVLVFSFFYFTTTMQQQKLYDFVFCASFYLVENKFYFSGNCHIYYVGIRSMCMLNCINRFKV